MRDHVTEASAIPLVCPDCGCTDLLYGIDLGEVLAATLVSSDGAPTTGEQHARPLWESQHWPERGAIVCRGFSGRAALRRAGPGRATGAHRRRPGRGLISITAAPGTNPYIAALRGGDLFADPAYQRDLDSTRVKRMRGELDRTLLGVIEVSERADGRYAIVDGQHRWAVLQAAGGPDAHLVCQVHTGLSIEDEARLFYEIDTRRKTLSWWDRWRARRGAGDPQVLGIDEVLRRHGLQVNPAPTDGNIRATKALETIVNDLGDLRMLDHVLIVLTAAFGRSFDAFDGGILQGVALVLGHYAYDELDADRLVRQLRDIPPRQLRARALALREAHRGTVPRLCAAVIVERYNAGRGRNVEEFFTRAPSASKARASDNRSRRQRAGIRSWAERNGHDIAASRTIPPRVRRAYEEAQVTAQAPGTDAFDEQESPTVGVPDLAGVQRALRNGRGLRWVMDAYGLDYQTAKAIRDHLHAGRSPGTPA